MFPLSAAILASGVVVGLSALAIFLLALRRGEFDDPGAAAMSLFDELDLRYERPWESAAQREERVLRHGPLIPAPPSAWGGA